MLSLQKETSVVRIAKKRQQSLKHSFIYLHVISQFISRSYHIINNSKFKDVSLKITGVREIHEKRKEEY